MAEEQDKHGIPPLPTRSEEEIPLDTRLLSEAVIELNISRKNVGIYPPGHIQITKSIDRAFDFLQKLFEIRDEMTLGVAKDTLLVGRDYLDPKNPVYRDLALSLNQRGIAAVTFVRGLDKGELVNFHGILTRKPDEITAAGGIGRLMEDSGVVHIRVLAVDYGSFHVTEEAEILAPKGKLPGKSGVDLWQDFVSHLAAGTLAGQGQGVSLHDAEHIDPAELARLLNERKLDMGSAVQSYDRIITTYLRGSAEKKQLTAEQSNTLESLNALLRNLNPELRKQFLSVVFEHVSSGASVAGTEEMIGGLADDMVIEMLSQANTEGREISPTLAGLIGKLAKTQAGPSGEGARGGGIALSGALTPVILPEHVQKLFDREKYEDYVPGEYESLLRRMTTDTALSLEAFPVAEHEKSLQDEELDFQIGRALLAFMEEEIDEEDYGEFARKLTAIMPGFLQTGNFELLLDISETLGRHGQEKPSPAMRAAAADARAAFSDPEFIAGILEAFELWMRDKGQEAAGLVQSLGSAAIPGLMDIFSKDETFGGRRVVFNLLCLFGEPAVAEAEKRLGDERKLFVRNLLIFLRRAGGPSSIPAVKPLLQHKSQTVRMEALSTLLKFRDPGAVEQLRAAIRSEDPDVAAQGVALAGQYRIDAVTDDVLAKIKRVIIFETDYGENEEVIKALGEIGDPRAIPELEKLARSAFSLYPKSNLRMKETIFESLTRYPKDRIGGLIAVGERLNSEKIRRLCGKYTDGTR